MVSVKYDMFSMLKKLKLTPAIHNSCSTIAVVRIFFDEPLLGVYRTQSYD